MSKRAEVLAERLEVGAHGLAAFAIGLDDRQWQTRFPPGGRKAGVIIHHVASMYPLETQLAQMLAEGRAIVGVTMADVHAINAEHARVHDTVTREATLELLGKNSAAAADFIRRLSDDELDRAAPVSLCGGAPLTCQFMLEDHAVRHSYHHLAQLRAVQETIRSAA